MNSLPCLVVPPRVPSREEEPRSKTGTPAQDQPSSTRRSPARSRTALTCGGAAAPESRRPWLRGPRASALGHASGSAPPGACRAAASARAAVIGPARHVDGERASLPGKGNPLPAPWPACAGDGDKGTSGDLYLSEWSASQPALVARLSAHCLSLACWLDKLHRRHCDDCSQGLQTCLCPQRPLMGHVKEPRFRTPSLGVSGYGTLHPTHFNYEGWRTGALILKFGLRFRSSVHLAQKLWRAGFPRSQENVLSNCAIWLPRFPLHAQGSQ